MKYIWRKEWVKYGNIILGVIGLWLLEVLLGGIMFGIGGGRVIDGNGGIFEIGDEIGFVDYRILYVNWCNL